MEVEPLDQFESERWIFPYILHRQLRAPEEEATD